MIILGLIYVLQALKFIDTVLASEFLLDLALLFVISGGISIL